ncbi:molybdenum cofactor biosynthesis protein MoaE [Alicyclobacillus sp. SO9]|uniref:molybdenum cofactor biosynthesis protein n=1 Tax=Alicyclobacillus sp. SO9 TaxID=2665646 RepID=UPI0018E80FFE|nr:molybdenum cofactor biosynthesis protein MoaE [Alicyclobacillus sp. SO9]
MTIHVRIFAGLAEAFQQSKLSLPKDLPMTVQELRKLLIDEYPAQKAALTSALIAVNQTYVPDETQIDIQDEVALIPPVGGGDSLPTCMISDAALSVDAAMQQLESVYHGGTVVFCGTVREFTKQRQTLKLTYEAYTDMALQQMRRIEDEIKAEYPRTSLLQWHRVGTLAPSEIAVICAAASPHRDDSFAAARILIERLKKEVPIWKKEFYADGDATWQPNEPADPV